MEDQVLVWNSKAYWQSELKIVIPLLSAFLST